MPKQSSRDVEDAVVEAYLAGALVTDLQNRFGLARSTVYAILRRSHAVPTRFQGEVATEKDQMIVGLRQLNVYLEHRVAELEAEVAQLTKAAQQRRHRATG